MINGDDDTVQEIDDAALFALATSEPVTGTEDAGAAAPATTGPAADAATPGGTQPAADAGKQQEAEHRVPLRELLDERDRRQQLAREMEEERRQRAELQRQIDALRNPQQPIDLLTNPQGFQESIEERFAREQAQAEVRAQRDRFDVSCMIAETKYGDEVHKAFEAFEAVAGATKGNDRALRERIIRSPNPAEMMVQWYRQANTLRETGGDLNAYRERLLKEERDRLAKDPEFRKQILADLRTEAASRPPVTQLPPSLNRVPAAASNAGEDDRDLGDAELFSHALRRRR